MNVKTVLVSLLACLTASVVSAAGIPPAPATDGAGYFIEDYAGVLPDGVRERIGRVQKTAFEAHDTPIVVVTIYRMSKYGGSGQSIESFAREWFDSWKIGTADRPGGANKGILVLVSVGDRKARIELGADWGRKWDGYCRQIMDRDMIPNFKHERYDAGIMAAVNVLGSMAAKGPRATPPRKSVTTTVRDAGKSAGPSIGYIILLAIGGFILSIFGGTAGGSHSGSYSSSSYSSSSSGGYSGGGYSGGTSGGGGASGSW